MTKAGIMNTSTEVMILVNRAVHLGLSAFRSMNSQVDHVFNVCSFVKEHDMNMQWVLHFCSSFLSCFCSSETKKYVSILVLLCVLAEYFWQTLKTDWAQHVLCASLK